MTLEEARDYFANDRFASYKTGIIIEEIGENYARCSFETTPDDMAAHGSVMGGAVFTLADFTFAVATNTREQLTVTTSSTINFISMTKDKKLVAETRCLKNGRKACFFEITVKDGTGKLIATVLSNGIHL